MGVHAGVTAASRRQSVTMAAPEGSRTRQASPQSPSAQLAIFPGQVFSHREPSSSSRKDARSQLEKNKAAKISRRTVTSYRVGNRWKTSYIALHRTEPPLSEQVPKPESPLPLTSAGPSCQSAKLKIDSSPVQKSVLLTATL